MRRYRVIASIAICVNQTKTINIVVAQVITPFTYLLYTCTGSKVYLHKKKHTYTHTKMSMS